MKRNFDKVSNIERFEGWGDELISSFVDRFRNEEGEYDLGRLGEFVVGDDVKAIERNMVTFLGVGYQKGCAIGFSKIHVWEVGSFLSKYKRSELVEETEEQFEFRKFLAMVGMSYAFAERGSMVAAVEAFSRACEMKGISAVDVTTLDEFSREINLSKKDDGRWREYVIARDQDPFLGSMAKELRIILNHEVKKADYPDDDWEWMHAFVDSLPIGEVDSKG
ncbi:hypothetical protein DRH14_02770 [Candidatus Shapirobacteria bacterium]|nr:MAG: hypothetical protein DRH14_02770 [Candidatus Shapirobacteria bacterium]